jgi:hypothetical protein
MMSTRRASLFDLGVYAGGTYTTDWFTTPETGGEEEGWAPGYAPIFGAVANFWFSPTFGVRAHGGYMPQTLPSSEAFDEENRVVNSYLYDLDLVFRPFFFGSDNRLMQSVYFFLGGGGYTADIADQAVTPGFDDSDGIACGRRAAWVRAGVCVSNSPEYSTTGQGVLGAGLDLFPIGSSLALFGEAAVHGYDSPAHVNDDTGTGEDKFTFTPRAVLGLKAMFGDILPPPPPPVELPPVITPPQPEQPVVAPVITTSDIQVCVLQDGNLTNTTATYNTATGDTTVNGTRFSEAFPVTGQYAANASWFINNQPITFNGTRYVKYGLPRVLGVSEVSRVGEFQGVSLFAETGMTGRPEVVYVLVRPGCEFQPYNIETKASGVRG